MIWAVAAEAVAICVLTLLVLALAHAYAGLAAAVRSGERASPVTATPRPVPAGDRATEAAPETVRGTTPEGEAVVIPLDGAAGHVLLAFVSSTCASCRGLMEGLDTAADALGSGLRVVVVAKGPERESPTALRRLVGTSPGVDVVLSTEAWSDLAVPGSPYFVHVDGRSARVLGEGTAVSWPQVAELLALSAGDRSAEPGQGRAGARGLEDEVDRELRAAGILPGDPSLYPPAARAS